MEDKSFGKYIHTLIPLVLSGFLCIALIYLFFQKIEEEEGFVILLREVTPIFIGLSIVSAAIIFSYMVFTLYTKHIDKISSNKNLISLIKKMNKVQSIVEILLDSKIWLPGVKNFIDNEFQGLTYFEVKEFYRGKSKLAIEFLQEKKSFNDTETLYLELKSLLLQDPKQKKIIKKVSFPEEYKINILKKWQEHKCGSGLWYYFGYRFGDYKEAFDIDAVFERHQDKILVLANEIDGKIFEDSSFNEVFLSRLGEYINKQIIPQLLQRQNQKSNGMPKSIELLYILFATTIIIGILIPLLTILLSLPAIGLGISYAIIISMLFYASICAFSYFSRKGDK